MIPESTRFPLAVTTRLNLGCIWLAALSMATGFDAHAATGTWQSTAPGNWSDGTKWTGGVPDAPGDTADFINNISGTCTVSLTGDKTVGSMNIGDSLTGFAAFTIAPGLPTVSGLIFDQVGTADAALTVPVVGGVATNLISANVLLKDNLVITTGFPDSSKIQLNFSGSISEDGSVRGITKQGQGIIRFSNYNSFTGGLAVNEGRIDVNQNYALGRGPVSVGNGGQVYLYASSVTNDFTISGTGYNSTADTSAKAGAIRIGNQFAVLGDIEIQSAGARISVVGGDLGFLAGNLTGSGDLEVNGPTTTTGGITLAGNGAGYTGHLHLSRGDFTFRGGLGGSLTTAPASASPVSLLTGSSIAGDVTLDSSIGQITLRNSAETLAIGGKLDLSGATVIAPSVFPAPGTPSFTVMSFASRTGSGGFSFDATGFRGNPVLAINPTSVAITGLDGQTRTWNNASGDSIWSAGGSNNWAGGDQLFQHADAVVFDDTAAGTVNIVGTVKPQSVTFNNTGTHHFTLAGTGSINAAGGGIIKNGGAWLTLGGANTFTGPVMINAGRLIAGSPGVFGRTSGVHLASGSALNLNGQLLASTSLWIAGDGDGEVPALTDGSTGFGGIRNITLTADASFGGNTGNDFTIGSYGVVDGMGFTFTKVGANEVRMLGFARNLHTVVRQGTLSGWGNDPFGSSVRIKPGARLKISRGGDYSSDLAIEGVYPNDGRLIHDATSNSSWTGKITVDSDLVLQNNSGGTVFTITQGFSVPSRFIVGGIVNAGLVVLLGEVDVGDHVSIINGALVLGNGGSGGGIRSDVPIVMTGYAQLAVNRSDDLIMPNVLSDPGYASFLKQGTGTLTLTADLSFSGSAFVLGGKLLVNGNNSGTGSFRVTTGTVLGGKGTLPGAVTVDAGGTVAPGTSIGTFTVGSPGYTTTINGTLTIEYDGSAPAPADLLESKGPLSLGATSALVIQAVGSPLQGAFYWIATTTARSGTFASVTGIPAGYQLVYTNSGAYLVSSIYQAWFSSHFPGITDPAIIGPTADPDGDHLDNMTENLFGTDPSAWNQGLRPVSGTVDSLTFRHSHADAPVPYFTGSYEWSVDLTNWHASGQMAAGVTVNCAANIVQDKPSPEPDVVEVVASVTGEPASRVFLRHKTFSP